MPKQQNQEYYFLKFGKYIVTIQDLSNNLYKDIITFSSTTYKFKIISIEDICGIFYDEIDDFEIEYLEIFRYIGKIKIGQIFDNQIYKLSYYLNKNDAYYDRFIQNQQWRLFPNGFTNFCKYNYAPNSSIEVFLDNGKIIGTLKIFINEILKWEIYFDNFDNYETIGEFKIILYNDDLSCETFLYTKAIIDDIRKNDGGGGYILDLILSLEYFS